MMGSLFNVVADCRVQLYQKEVFAANFPINLELILQDFT